MRCTHLPHQRWALASAQARRRIRSPPLCLHHSLSGTLPARTQLLNEGRVLPMHQRLRHLLLPALARMPLTSPHLSQPNQMARLHLVLLVS